MAGRLVGLIAGEGTSPAIAKKALEQHGYSVPVTIAPFSKGGLAGSSVRLQLHEVSRISACLASHRVDHVVHIGDVSLDREITLAQGAPHYFKDDSPEAKVFNATTIELKLELLAASLRKYKLNPVHINRLVPEFQIGTAGWIVAPSDERLGEIEHFAIRLEKDIANRIAKYDNPRALRRTTIYDRAWQEPVSHEARTHGALEQIRQEWPEKDADSLRALVKVGGQIGMDCAFEAPVFRTELVRLCDEHSIDLAVLNAAEGVLVDKDAVIDVANELGVAIRAMMPPKVSL